MSVPIFLINLDSSAERLAHCQSELQRQGLDFRRISAIYGRNLTDSEKYRHYNEKLNRKAYHKPLTPGEIGCYLSHRKAWNLIVENNLPCAIVVEDDFSLAGDLTQAMEQLKQLTMPWDYIKLAPYKRKQGKVIFEIPLQSHKLTVFDKAMTGCCAQAISLQGARKLLAHSEQFGRPVDTDIQHWWERDIQILNLQPFVILPNLDFESDIGKTDRNIIRQKQNKWRKWILQMNKYLQNRKATKALLRQLQRNL